MKKIIRFTVFTVLLLCASQSVCAQYSEELLAKAKAGDAVAQYNLGLSYFEGDGIKVNVNEAIKWVQMSANQGDPDAQFYIGLMYYGGDGVKEDETEAIKWWEKAAAQGHEEAKDYLKKIGH